MCCEWNDILCAQVTVNLYASKQLSTTVVSIYRISNIWKDTSFQGEEKIAFKYM